MVETVIKEIICRAGATEWRLARLEPDDFKLIARFRIVGHPAYWRIVPPDDPKHDPDRPYEVWPLPASTVTVVPVCGPLDPARALVTARLTPPRL